MWGCAELQPGTDAANKPRDAAEDTVQKDENGVPGAPLSETAKNGSAESPSAAAESKSTDNGKSAPSPAGSDTKPDAKVTVEVVTPKRFREVIARHKGKSGTRRLLGHLVRPCCMHFLTLSKWERSTEDLVLVSMNFDDPENEETVLEFLTEHKATFDNMISKFGGEDESFRAYDIDNDALPHYKLYGRDGKLAHKFATEELAEKQFTKEDIEAKVKELLAEN